MTSRVDDAWIDSAFAGHGVAIRRREDPPVDGEPFVSMEVAKAIARRAAAVARGD